MVLYVWPSYWKCKIGIHYDDQHCADLMLPTLLGVAHRRFNGRINLSSLCGLPLYSSKMLEIVTIIMIIGFYVYAMWCCVAQCRKPEAEFINLHLACAGDTCCFPSSSSSSSASLSSSSLSSLYRPETSISLSSVFNEDSSSSSACFAWWWWNS